MKNKIIAGILMVGLGAFAFASLAGAQTSTTVSSSVTSTLGQIIKANFNQKVEINTNGQAQIRGTVVGTSTNAVMVKTWGGIWTAEVSTGTMILAHGGKVALASLRSGDQVSVHGTMIEGKSVTVSAKVIKDYSLKIKEKKVENDDDEKEAKKESSKKNIVQKIVESIKNKGKASSEVTVTGKVICLPKKNAGEMQTLECAMGLETSSGNYALNLEDETNLQAGATVTLTGKVLPLKNSIYNAIGTIKVSD